MADGAVPLYGGACGMQRKGRGQEGRYGQRRAGQER